MGSSMKMRFVGRLFLDEVDKAVWESLSARCRGVNLRCNDFRLRDRRLGNMWACSPDPNLSQLSWFVGLARPNVNSLDLQKISYRRY